MGREPQARTLRGVARVTFIAHLALIRTELEQGWTARAIYDRHPDKFRRISYPQFARYVRQLKEGAGLGDAIEAVWSPAAGRFLVPTLLGERPEAASVSPVAAAAERAPGPPSRDAEGESHVGRSQPGRNPGQPVERRFKPHDNVERPGDWERLVGGKPPR